MRMHRKLSRAAALLPLAAALAGCFGRRESEVGAPKDPLVILFSPSHAPAGSQEPLRFIERGLSSRTGMAVVVKVASSPVDAIDQFGRRAADAGILTLDEFLLAREEYEVREGLQILRGNGETSYDGVILVRAMNAPKDLQALNGLTVAFVDPYSVSGFLLSAQRLREAGVQVEPVFAGSHDKALQALLKGEVAAAATYGDVLAGRLDAAVLARTGTAPNEPLIFRRGLLPAKRDAVASAFKDLAGTAEGKKALKAVANITGFGPVQEDAYRPIHDLIQAAEKTVYDIVPGGEDIRRLNQPYIDVR
ncbi:MAG: PhnD/SsuA/transferrin family substrate-binding protein [Elusimicrobia bacterium]|nr:PhnD/SsuA/transferrin family substrate-binding protein [Elusimicrobiota bacterium]